MDAWSSTTRVLFLGITGHYINKAGRFQSLLLGFERLRGSHTADCLSRVCYSVFQRFAICENIRAITTDNASTNTKMLKLLGKSLPGLNPKSDHIKCMAHVINLAVQELLSHLRITALDSHEETETLSRSNISQIPKVFAKARYIIAKI